MTSMNIISCVDGFSYETILQSRILRQISPKAREGARVLTEVLYELFYVRIWKKRMNLAC